MANTLGSYIHNVRKSKRPKMSQSALGKIAGVTKSYISMIENDRVPNTDKPPGVSLKVLSGIARGLEVPLDELVNRAGHIMPEGYEAIAIEGDHTKKMFTEEDHPADLPNPEAWDRMPEDLQALIQQTAPAERGTIYRLYWLKREIERSMESIQKTSQKEK